MEKIRVGIVNYLNTRPLIYGLQKPPISDRIILVGDYPARVAEMLLKGEIDVGLVPVAVIPQLPPAHIIGNYCIGTEGEIASVALFSDVPMNEIKAVYLDYQSKTSVALLKYLMRESWGIHPEIIESTGEDYREKIKGTTAGLVIGDRAFEQRKISNFIYDLGSEWRAITGLPFTFAAWVSTRKLPDDFISYFNEANGEGLQYISNIVEELNYDLFDLRKYYLVHLSYQFDERKKKGMEQFISILNENRQG